MGFRILKTNGFACINIGDATRKLGDDFYLYPNHARVLQRLTGMGFHVLPAHLHVFHSTGYHPGPFFRYRYDPGCGGCGLSQQHRCREGCFIEELWILYKLRCSFVFLHRVIVGE